MERHFQNSAAFFEFCMRVTRQARFILPAEAAAFLETLFVTSETRKTRIANGVRVWRAQLGCDVEKENDSHPWGEEEVPYPPARMKPLADSASEGRVNAKGIPCLYVATDRDTAIAEVRPWVNTLLSVGEFAVTRDLEVIDCSVGHDVDAWDDFVNHEESDVDGFIWREVDRAFAIPITDTGAKADYAPTQIIAEFFKMRGFDGLIYKSSLGPGKNIALFKRSSADLVSCSLVRTERVTYQLAEVPYSWAAYHVVKSAP